MKNKFDYIEFDEVSLGETVKCRIGIKSLSGGLFIDVRKWQKYPNTDDYLSTSKGVMVSIENWELFMPIIQKYLDQNKRSKTANSHESA